jgi:hypothetical protein
MKYIIIDSIEYELTPVIKKDYEILSFKGTLPSNSQGLFTKRGNKFFYKDSITDWLKEGIEGLPEDSMFGDTTVIYSIKRLSDSEIFTVGDRVVYTGKSNYAGYTIGDFFIKEDTVLVRSDGFLICEYLKDIKKVKEPLFVTEDGKEIFEGDRVFLIKRYKEPSFASIAGISTWHSTFGNNGKPIESDLAYYSEEAAQKWIDENKPKYSKKDVVGIIRIFDNDINDYYDATDSDYFKYVEEYDKPKGMQ